MGEFKLSAVLAGHASDVRAVKLPEPGLAITASRDGTTKFWKQTPSSPPSYESTESSHSATYKTCLAFSPPTKEYPEGLIISGGQDAIIEARQLASTAEKEADGLMVGHSNQVCSLDVNIDEGWIVSGSWDGTAKLWSVGGWEPKVDFPDHGGAVWAVLAYSKDIVVTGAADQGIRVFDTNAKLISHFSAKDVCRALAKIPEDHSSRGQLLSASNDGIIRIWTLKGQLISELHGHEAFIYSLAVLPNGNFVSSGEDRTVRVWNDTYCIQTITLPAVSVWSVNTCSNGDIIAGSSDKLARIFTTDASRMADPTVQAAFEDSVKSSSIPQQTIGDINKTDMEGPSFLQRRSGTKDGQVQMIKEDDGSISAYSWSASKQSWDKVGTVVDAIGSGNKKNYGGKEYDYVFDVDIEDGKPAIKLPFNINENPHEVATKWLQDNNLPLTYLEQTANFIVSNSQGATIGESKGASSAQYPTGTESRAPEASKKLPQQEYVPIVAGKPDASHQHILKLNSKYTDSGDAKFALSDNELQQLAGIFKELQKAKFDGKEKPPTSDAVEAVFPTAIRIATEWEPSSNRLAGLDLLRFLAAVAPVLAICSSQEKDLVAIVVESGVFEPDFLSSNTKLAMVSLRVFVNLMYRDILGRELLDIHCDTILEKIKNLIPYCSKDSALSVALTTFYLNLAVWLTKPENTNTRDRQEVNLTIIESVSAILSTLPPLSLGPGDPARQQATEPVYRGIFAIGTVLVGSDSPEVKDAAESIFGIGALLARLKERGYLEDARFGGLVGEVKSALA